MSTSVKKGELQLRSAREADRVAIRELLESWKQSEPCDHHSGERYYRKHFFRVLTDSGEVMTLYALRHVKRGQDPKSRWWLYAIETPKNPPGAS